MAFNSSWVYSLPSSVNPVIGGTRITTAWAITTLGDLATALSALGSLVGPGQTLGTDIGFLDIVVNAPGAGVYTTVLADRGKMIYKTDFATVTIPPVADVAYPVGSAITIRNFSASDLTIAEGTGVNLYVVLDGIPDDRTIAAYGIATFIMEVSDQWIGTGAGLS